MTDGAENSYDRVVYPGNPIVETHPDRLATVAALFGMRPAPAFRCRVLELGCGLGGNLVAMAYQRPDSRFVGLDASARSIAIGNRNIAEIGLKNVALHHLDIMEVGDDFGVFDYIIAHGVYSWVPSAVRERLLALAKALLAPEGVAYVSYNAYPGAHLREVARDMMLFHVRDIDDPREKIAQGCAWLRFAAEAIPQGNLHGRIVRDQLRRVEGMAQEVIYHDDLAPGATPFLLHEVAEAAARHGLQYLGDATFGASRPVGLPEAAARLIAQIPESDAVAREQYSDFVTGRAFRRTLLCHDDVVLNRNGARGSVKGFWLAADLAPASACSDGLADGAATFRTPRGGVLETDHPLAKAALAHLGTIWPQAIRFADLLAQAMSRLAAAGKEPDAADGAADALAGLLLQAYAAGAVELHLAPPPLTTVIAERPEASLLARKLAESGPVVTNLRHVRVVLQDAITRRFLTLVDGTRAVDALVRDLNAQLAAAAVAAEAFSPEEECAQPAPAAVTRAQVEENLRILARLALLVR